MSQFLKLCPQSDILVPTHTKQSTVHGCMRSTFVADVAVRRARVEDHDDLVPIFNRQSAALTEVLSSTLSTSVCLGDEISSTICIRTDAL
jgi:hypothetical protein